MAAHPLLVDTAVAVVYLVPTVAIGVATVFADPSPQKILTTLLAAVAGVALFARRHHPAIVFAVAIGTLAATIVFAESADILPAMLALYALAVYRSTRAAWIAFGVLAVVSAAAILTARLLQPTGFLSQRPGDPLIVRRARGQHHRQPEALPGRSDRPRPAAGPGARPAGGDRDRGRAQPDRAGDA
jgi:hypothetical protein